MKRLFHSIEWWLTNCVMCNVPGNGLRKLYLRFLGMRIGERVHIYEGFHIRNAKGILLEDGVSVGPKVLLDGREGLHIGKSVTIGYEAIIWTLNHDYNDIHFCSKGAPVQIKDYAWICSRSIILPGVTVGKGAVIASGAIVTKDINDYEIVAGIPARVIGHREIKEYDY